MTTNAKTRRGLAGGSQQEVLFSGGTSTTVLPLPVVRPIVLTTRGRIEFTGRCPKCEGWHRHIHLGVVRAPCGSQYNLQPARRGRRGRGNA